MLDLVVYDLLVPVDAEVVAGGGDISLGHAEGRLGASTVQFRSVALPPASESVGEVVLGSLLVAERPGGKTEFAGIKQRGALVVKAIAVGLKVIEPDVVGAAGVGPGEQQDRGGDS